MSLIYSAKCIITPLYVFLQQTKLFILRENLRDSFIFYMFMQQNLWIFLYDICTYEKELNV